MKNRKFQLQGSILLLTTMIIFLGFNGIKARGITLRSNLYSPLEAAAAATLPSPTLPACIPFPDGSDIALPTWTSDGAALAFISVKEPSKIVIRNTNTNRQLSVDFGANVAYLSWSPDAKHILVVTAELQTTEAAQSLLIQINLVNADGSGKQTLFTGGILGTRGYPSIQEFGFPTWSPDGRQIAFVAHTDMGDGKLYVVDADGTGLTPMIGAIIPLFASPQWTPDGKHLVALTSDGIDILDLANNFSVHQIIPPKNLASFILAPDGQKIAFGYGSGYELYVAQLDGSQVHLLNSKARLFAWSPKSDRIAVFSKFGALAEIDISNSDGSDQHQVVLASSDSVFSLAWSPDGQAIAFLENRTLYLVNVDKPCALAR